MFQHILFDCFGTLIDTGNSSVNATGMILRSVNSKLGPALFYKEWKALKREWMNAPDFYTEKVLYEKTLAFLFKKYGITADASKEVQPMIDILFGTRKLYPDVKETFRRLTEKGIDYVIASTTDTDCLEYYLRYHQIEGVPCYTSEDLRMYKPNPAFYRTVLQRTGWKTEDCLFVGDSLLDDVEGPRSVGLKTALLDRKGNYAGQSPAPDYIIRALTELPDLVEKQ